MIDKLIEDLNTADEVVVTFTTKKGLVRTMNCTTNEYNIPKEELDGRNDPKLNGEAIVAVYDYDNSAWRAFRKDAVISYKVITWD
jgi:hypothetical protein